LGCGVIVSSGVLWADEGRGEIVRKRGFLLASSYYFYYSLRGREGASSAVFLVLADPVCIPEREEASSSWRVRGWKKGWE
jgi:hypothetical protein